MLLKKSGLPEEYEIVLCTVMKVQGNGVFARLDEYDITGMIHISEISPGRIRNIRDFVKEGKVIICKILKVNRERGQIDLSLRRVTEAQRRNKVETLKQEQKAEKIIEHVAQKLGMSADDVYKAVSEPILKQYESIFAGLVDVVESDTSLEKIGIPEQIAAELRQIVLLRMKRASVEVKAELKLRSYASDGVDVVKSIIKLILAVDPGLRIKYEAGGSYAITVTADDYKAADAILVRAEEVIKKDIKKLAMEAEAELVRERK